ncbi:uncharacterized protein LOC127284060 [Leptopilina boulardi]|uniref:uncharacterized protein LOC127284060 n=1 Tax=Leptopilina boulardi TaxID=63433 RepID=UPI0021F68B1B|nr:uncharacterized protein LOC127284060 [Leptopilina boulardi]
MGELLIVSVYRVPGKQTPPIYWKRFFNSIKNLNFKSIFIGGDFNSHSTLWGGSYVCSNARNLCEQLDEIDLIILNNGSPTLAGRPPNPGSALDLTMVSPNLYTSSSWNVHVDPLGSDHFPILTSLGVTIPISIFSSHKYNLRSINWPLFSENLRSSIESNINLLNTNDPIADYNNFIQLVDTSISEVCPQRKISHTHTTRNATPARKPFVPAPWWNSKCDEAIKNRKTAFTNYKLSSNYPNYINYKKAEAIAKRTLNEARRQSFRTFCDSLDRHTPLTKIWSKPSSSNISTPSTSRDIANIDDSRNNDETPVPIELDSPIRVEERDSGLSGPEIQKEIDKLRKDLEAKKKLLVTKKAKAERERKYRLQRKETLNALRKENPDVIRESSGRPRLEDDQSELLKAIIDIATFDGAADSRRRTELVRSCKTLHDLHTELQAQGFKISQSGTTLELSGLLEGNSLTFPCRVS